jgi:hypothetical protein
MALGVDSRPGVSCNGRNGNGKQCGTGGAAEGKALTSGECTASLAQLAEKMRANPNIIAVEVDTATGRRVSMKAKLSEAPDTCKIAVKE